MAKLFIEGSVINGAAQSCFQLMRVGYNLTLGIAGLQIGCLDTIHRIQYRKSLDMRSIVLLLQLLVLLLRYTHGTPP